MRHRILFGVGINDSPIPVKVDGKFIKSYETWKSIIQRCYSKKSLTRYPSYNECTICDKWKSFSVFKEWHDKNHVEGWHIDKDILIEGNKIYSPSTCRFVPHFINSLLLDRKSGRGEFPIGVNYEKVRGKYKACISKYGKVYHLGYFNDSASAFNAWRLAKIDYVLEVANNYLTTNGIDLEIYQALVSRTFASE